MNYRTKLRQEYHKETGNYWKKINVNAEPTIDYVKWLENKLKKGQKSPLDSVSNWVDATKETPTPFLNVLVHFKGQWISSVRTATWDGVSWSVRGGEPILTDEITHWKNIENPPLANK